MYVVYNKNHWDENTVVYADGSKACGNANYLRRKYNEKGNIVVIVDISKYALVSDIIGQIKGIPKRVEKVKKALEGLNHDEAFELFGDFADNVDIVADIWKYFELGEIEEILF